MKTIVIELKKQLLPPAFRGGLTVETEPAASQSTEAISQVVPKVENKGGVLNIWKDVGEVCIGSNDNETECID